MDELHALAQSLERGDLSAALTDAFVHGTAVGGARPKAPIRDGGSTWIAKLSTSTDPYPVVKAEAAAMALADRVGIGVPRTRVTRSLGRDVLLVQRFDRPGDGRRRLMVSALTMLGDDQARNYAAFWNGEVLELTAAYDLCPQLRSGTESRQAMDIAADGSRDSRFSVCVGAAESYGLSRAQARDVVERIVSTIRNNWTAVADEVGLTGDERALLWGCQFLNDRAFDGYR